MKQSPVSLGLLVMLKWSDGTDRVIQSENEVSMASFTHRLGGTLIQSVIITTH